MVPPSGNEILVGFADGRHEHAAARMQFGEGLVEFLWVECREKVVNGRDVPFEDGRRCRVVVPLGDCFGLLDLRLRQERPVRFFFVAYNIIL